MSHFTTLVLLPTKDYAGNSLKVDEKAIDHQLAPYDENHPVPPYEEICYCVGYSARIRSREQVDREMGTIEEARIKFQDKWSKIKDRDEEKDKDWADNVYKPREEREKEILAEQVDKETPDPTCDECHGTGKVFSQYNPASKWDWWRVGGRWDGFFGGEEEMKNRESENGFNFNDSHQDISKNCAPVGSLLDENGSLSGVLGCPPFAIVSQDGRWYEKGKMGWWGIVIDEKAAMDWKTQVEAILKENFDCVAVIVDCHI